MKESQMHVMMDICTQLERLGMTRSDLAEIMHVEPNTVNKQLTKQNGELTLATAYRYAAALHGAIVFLTDDEYDTLKRTHEILAENESLRQQILSMKAEHDQKEDRLNRISATLSKVQAQNDDFAEKLMEKDKELYASASTIRKLLEKYAF